MFLVTPPHPTNKKITRQIKTKTKLGHRAETVELFDCRLNGPWTLSAISGTINHYANRCNHLIVCCRAWLRCVFGVVVFSAVGRGLWVVVVHCHLLVSDKVYAWMGFFRAKTEA